ncbi:hypothetical protein CIK06_26780 [Plantactinospora sp. KBS50]|nr:hypothetical protein CIK06_26780 [Plantactinospora sp. KBS50]
MDRRAAAGGRHPAAGSPPDEPEPDHSDAAETLGETADQNGPAEHRAATGQAAQPAGAAGDPAGGSPPAGWTQAPPPGWTPGPTQGPPAGWPPGSPPPGWTQGPPPAGWTGNPPGWTPGSPPPGWTGPPPGWTGPPPGWTPGAPPPGWAGPPPGWTGSPVPPGFPLPTPYPHGLALAALGPRLVARLIDITVVLLLNVLVNGWFVWRYVQEVAPVYREIFRRSMAGDSSTENLPQAGEQAAGLQIVILLIIVALWFAYEVPALASSGQTLGKRLMGVKVVSLGTEPGLTFARSMRRWNVLGGIPVFLWVCCVGFVIQVIDSVYPLFDRPLRQALHDKAAQTVVVRVPRVGTPAPTGGGNTDSPGGSE